MDWLIDTVGLFWAVVFFLGFVFWVAYLICLLLGELMLKGISFVQDLPERIRERREQEAQTELTKRRTEIESLKEKLELEISRIKDKLRDLDVQPFPYNYRIGDHGNRALAIRYGIANQEKKINEYTYHQRGEMRRDPSRDRTYWVPAQRIAVRKVRRESRDQFIARLPDYGNRRVRVVIEPGTDYIKTFLPLHDSWFEKFGALEETLKNNPSFTLRELAKFHVDKTI